MSPRPALLAALLGAMLLGPARAADPPAPEVPDLSGAAEARDRIRGLARPPEEAPTPPSWAAIAFEDAPGSGDCPPIEARFGRCVERVQFADLSALWERGATDAKEDFAGREISRLSLSLWEELAMRWEVEGDLPLSTLRAEGHQTLPTAAETWDVGTLSARRRVALPARDRWLGEEAWLGERAFFPAVRFAQPSGAPPPPALVTLSGRFAVRMGYDGRSYDYQLMDADPGQSAPFFEQMYPFSSAASRAERRAPLADLAWPGVNTAALLSEDSYAAFLTRASAAFEDLERSVGITIAQFALEEFTPNQMRVLSALTLMRSPPGGPGRTGGRTSDLVAAALGQTDDTAAAQATVQRQQLALEQGFNLRYSQIPASVVEPWLAQLATPEAQAQVGAVWRSRVRGVLGDLLRSDAPAAAGMDGPAIDAWLKGALRPGQDLDALALESRRVALSILVEALPVSERNRVESWIFLDHVNDDVASGLDPSGATVATPAALVQIGTDAWVNTIRLHGRASQPLPQAMGGVDPTAVCTTLDGRAAQAEPSIRPVELSVLLAGPQGLTQASDVLWQGRAATAVLAVDSPTGVPAQLDRVVDLPDGQSLYRVRWRVWSGWHVLWSVEHTAEGAARLGARTAAICSDLVLSPPDLVATVLRAATLDGEQVGPVPPPRGASAPDAAGQDPGQGALLRSLGRAPLSARAAAEGGLLLMVFDLDPEHEGALPTRHSPYLSERRRLEGGGLARASAWALYLGAAPGSDRLVSPGLRPSASTAPDTARPVWTRATVGGWTLGGGLGLIPLRASWFTCEVDPTDTDVVAPCPDGVGPLLSSGGAVDLSAQYTIWLGPKPRFAVSGGPAMRLDVQTPGGPWLEGLGDPSSVAWPVGAGPDYAWTLRAAAGLSVGLRLQPLPGGLVHRGQPWGADGPSGRSRVGRSALGLQLDLLTGPGYNGLEWTGAAELWGARSLPVGRAARESLRPYRPSLWVGPYARGQVGFLLGEPEVSRALELTQSVSVIIGVRSWLRLAGEPPAAPELP